MQFLIGKVEDALPSRSKRRRYKIDHSTTEPEEPSNRPHSVEMVPLETGNEEKVEAYYESAFKAFQQINCRQIAKAYIKIIEPRKQVKYPYNGGRGGPGEKGDPEKTKPDWWPAGVPHREPDHLLKPERICLLIHIFRKLGNNGMTANKLEEAGRGAQSQIKPRERLGILDEIYKVRRAEESYERGEADANTVVYIVNRDKKRERTPQAIEGADRGSTYLSKHGLEKNTKCRMLSPSPYIISNGVPADQSRPILAIPPIGEWWNPREECPPQALPCGCAECLPPPVNVDRIQQWLNTATDETADPELLQDYAPTYPEPRSSMQGHGYIPVGYHSDQHRTQGFYTALRSPDITADSLQAV
ncbi:uncharacterized protein GIQ15_02001 [Arthroderma uncinatum]|uniref:uncharacterized protein n=1 Tax=Arthroderma uncinatum TaxID=74035 RepID=UPI00144AE22D|nr:uncharacterized protein GIQ15_02001 [Arthroderma uncinatum]KAF3482677.1 hypothetical protein GIQ15_02001 [Arthroderma uncinatum]